jgi:hypothetical protein
MRQARHRRQCPRWSALEVKELGALSPPGALGRSRDGARRARRRTPPRPRPRARRRRSGRTPRRRPRLVAQRRPGSRSTRRGVGADAVEHGIPGGGAGERRLDHAHAVLGGEPGGQRRRVVGSSRKEPMRHATASMPCRSDVERRAAPRQRPCRRRSTCPDAAGVRSRAAAPRRGPGAASGPPRGSTRRRRSADPVRDHRVEQRGGGDDVGGERRRQRRLARGTGEVHDASRRSALEDRRDRVGVGAVDVCQSPVKPSGSGTRSRPTTSWPRWQRPSVTTRPIEPPPRDEDAHTQTLPTTWLSRPPMRLAAALPASSTSSWSSGSPLSPAARL